jgi:hypothetical protein
MNVLETLIACAVLASAAIPVTAGADTTWLIQDATFSDGGTLTGTFSIDQYGYLDAASLTTGAGTVLGGQTYGMNSQASNDSFYIDFNPGYTTDLHIVFADPLTARESHDSIVLGGSSFECVGSFSCSTGQAGTVRYLTGGFATYVPEAATWAMMVLGAGLVGAGIRLTRDKRGVSAV